MKYIKIVYHFLVWVFYYIITMNARCRYLAGVHEGNHCNNMETNLTSTVYHYERGKKPEREYLTWREFWNQRGYLKS